MLSKRIPVGWRLGVIAVLATAAPAAAEPLRYAVVLSGKTAGAMTVERVDESTLRIDYEFSDRGRGPKLIETIRLDGDGLPKSVEIAGHDYLKNTVEESFSRDGDGRGVWKSSVERGEAVTRAYYLPFHGTPYQLAVLARALGGAPGRRLSLLPAGTATLEEAPPLAIESAGGVIAARPVLVAGLGFSPSTVWLDGAGELLAIADAWLSVVRAGDEAILERLVEAQRQASKVRWRLVAERTSRRPAGALAVRGVRLFDPLTLAVHEGWTVVVLGERVVALGRDGEVGIPPGAEILDGEGRTLLPGLWDMHAHLSELDGPLNLAAGITSARDLANDVDELTSLREQWSSGETLGPRIVAAGFLDGPGPYAGPTKALVDTAEAGREWIERYAELGYSQIKLYSSLRPELVAPLALEAHRRGLRVSGHVPAGMVAEQAIRDGYDEIQHINMVVLNFLPEIVETRTPARFTGVAARAVEIDPSGERFQGFVELLRAHGTVVDPTVGIFQAMFRDRAGEISGEIAAVADRLPPTVRRGYVGGGLPVPEGMEETYRRSAERLLELVGALHRGGVPIVAGTDALAGFALHRELELYVQAGIPAPEVLRLATLGAARIAGRSGELGRVAPGMLADFVLVEGRPDERIEEIRRVRTVVKGGRVIDAGALYGELGVSPEP